MKRTGAALARSRHRGCPAAPFSTSTALEVEQHGKRRAVVLADAVVGALGQRGVVEIDPSGRRAGAADDAADREGADAGVTAPAARLRPGTRRVMSPGLADALLVQRLLGDGGDRKRDPVDRVGLARGGDDDLFEADGLRRWPGPGPRRRAPTRARMWRAGEQGAAEIPGLPFLPLFTLFLLKVILREALKAQPHLRLKRGPKQHSWRGAARSWRGWPPSSWLRLADRSPQER